MESYIRELEDKIGQTRILGKKVSYEIYDAEGIGSRQEKQLQEMYAQDYDVMQGKLLKDLWKKQSRILDWNGNGMLDYVLVEGEESHFDAIRRTSGFLETGAELPLNQKGNILAEWKRELAYEKFAALDDEAVQNVEAVICNNDDMALGVYDYYKEKNLKLPVIIGINNSEEMHQKIMSGEMYGTIDNKMEDQVMEICRLMQAILKKDTGSYQKVWYSTPKAIVKAEGTE